MMEYLEKFKLKNKEEINYNGTCWIEFSIVYNNPKKTFWHNTSKYLSEEAYNLYTNIFEKYCNWFNYYGPSEFSCSQLRKIIKEIYIIRDDFKKIKTINELLQFVQQNCVHYNLEPELRKIFHQNNIELNGFILTVQKLSDVLITFLQEIVSKNKTLTILGL